MERIKKVFIKFVNLIDFIVSLLLIKIIHFKKTIIQDRTLLLIRLDSIGDYVLFRNFVSVIKTNNKYAEYKITLCGNIRWKDLAETFDSNNFETFIWVDRRKFRINPFYKYQILKKIYHAGFEIAIESAYTREILFSDIIIKASKAEQRIGSTGSPENYSLWKRKLFSDKFYTKLIPLDEKNIFEFYRNKEYMQKLLGVNIHIEKPSIDVSTININLPVINSFLVVVPGAQEKSRRWDIKNIIAVINHVLSRYEYCICIVGSHDDSKLANKITQEISSKRIIDLTGKTNLVQLAKLISKSELLISNDTSAVHFAAAVSTPFICISNGKHFGRFNPYPKEMNIKGTHVYPHYIESNLHSFEKLTEEFRFFSKININEITVDKVIEKIDMMLQI